MRRVEELLTQVLGLDVASIGSSLIHRAVDDRIVVRGLSHVDEYLALVLTDAGELQELIEKVVVPETWFLRSPGAFDALRDVVANEWMPVDRTRRRVLSVPCSTGEEPYSLAIVLSEMGLTREQVQIDAVDISQRVLAIARRGLYGANSFRGVAGRVREQYCTPLPGGGGELSPTIRDWVHFEQGNLVVPEFTPRAARYDVIFCRNVLIYFEHDMQRLAVERLYALLAPGGYLFVGPAEVPLAIECGFVHAGYEMSFMCRKPHADVAPAPAVQTTPAVAPTRQPLVREAPSLRRALLQLDPSPSRPSSGVTSPRVPASETLLPTESPQELGLAHARRLADAGRLAEAAAACEVVIQMGRMSVDALYLLGLVRDAMGRPDAAAECYRKVLFLDPNHADASLHLAVHAAREGDSDRAQRLHDRAQRIEHRAQGIARRRSS